MLTRRCFLTASTAALALPLYARRAFAADVDVVVIGAGAAGLAAAQELAKRGLSFIVIEASGRIGGRVKTDHDAFGVPYDLGAHWLHNGGANPFVRYGRRNGFDVYRAPEHGLVHVGQREATDADYEAFETALWDAQRAMERAGAQGRDVPPAQVMPDFGVWALTVEALMGSLPMGLDFEDFSCLDWYSGSDGLDWFCREGFGTLVAHAGRDVPVTLSTVAEAIRWGGAGVEVVTDAGTIHARAAIVTVSLGVLRSGDLRFDPPLPDRQQDAIAALPMGHYGRVTLQMSRDVFGINPDGFFTFQMREAAGKSPKGFYALVNAGGHGLTYCDMGGDFARQMSDAGPDAMYDYVLSELKHALGSNAARAVQDWNSFDWTTNPYTYGAYAGATPGGAWARAALRQPVADRLWFAGEALAELDWSMVAGAHKSGQKTAGRAAAAL